MYTPLLVFFAISLAFVAGGILVSLILTNRITNSSFTKKLPYECGIIRETETWQPLSISYFRYALLFILFDVEVVLLVPVLVIAREGTWILFAEVVLFIVLIFAGLAYAWKKKCLQCYQGMHE